MSENSENIVQQTRSNLKSNGKWAAKEAKNAIRDVQSEVQGEAESSISSARRTFDNMVDSVTDQAKGLSDKIDFSQASGFVEKYPIQIAFGALAVGFLFGAVLTRKTV